MLPRVVPRTGIEPVRPFSGKRRILSPLCLPISPSRPCRQRIVPQNKLLLRDKWAFSKWSGRRVSNSRPQAWQGCALPTELLPLGVWRRGPESNRPTRICNPVHNRFATAPFLMQKREAWASLFGIWSGKRVSNSRPQPWQGCALPTELFPRIQALNYSQFFLLSPRPAEKVGLSA
jgi:hypothetical protein